MNSVHKEEYVPFFSEHPVGGKPELYRMSTGAGRRKVHGVNRNAFGRLGSPSKNSILFTISHNIIRSSRSRLRIRVLVF